MNPSYEQLLTFATRVRDSAFCSCNKLRNEARALVPHAVCPCCRGDRQGYFESYGVPCACDVHRRKTSPTN